MKRSYKGLWLILAVAFVFFFAMSFYDDFTVGGMTLRTSTMADAVLPDASSDQSASPAKGAAGPVADCDKPDEAVPAHPKFPAPVDTASQVILLFGDSMLEGLSPRLAAYCNENGHTLYSVVWYSSTSEVWGKSDKLKKYIQQLNPSFIFVSLGANELFVKDIAEKRDKYVKKIIADIGDIPFVWIGPPNWKPDTGINKLVESNAPEGSFFLSDGMTFDRAKDGAHPTRSSAVMWMDSVVRWMPRHCNHPIRLDMPSQSTGKPKRVFVHQPSEM